MPKYRNSATARGSQATPGQGVGRSRAASRAASGMGSGYPEPMASNTMITATEVVAFWRDAGMGKWFGGGPAFDAQCREVLGEAHMAASRRELEAWLDEPEGALALLVLLDQVPRSEERRVGKGG